MLVEMGHANVAVVDEFGNTPIDIAEQHNMSETAMYLWEHGCESAAFHQASDVGRLSWSRPYIVDPPSARFASCNFAVGSKMFIFGGNGVSRRTIIEAPELPIDQSTHRTTILGDLYMIDFENVKERNLCYPDTAPVSHRSMTLSATDVGPDLHLHPDSLTIESRQPLMDCLPSAANSSRSYRASDGALCYFEVTVIHPGTRRIVSIGLTDKEFPIQKKHPGWLKGSYGFHGDDGSVFHASGHGRIYGSRWEAGDVIGCGVNFKTKEIFWTRNGQFLGIAYRGVSCPELWPTCGVRNPLAKLKFNFGASPFVFDFKVASIKSQWIPLPNSNVFSRYGHIEHLPNSKKLLLLPSPNEIAFLGVHQLDLESQSWEEVKLSRSPQFKNPASYGRIENCLYIFGAAERAEHQGCPFFLYSLNLCDLKAWNQLLPQLELTSGSLESIRDAMLDVGYILRDFSCPFMCAVGEELLFVESDKMLAWNPVTLSLRTQMLRGARPQIDHCSVTVVGDLVFTFGGWSNKQQLNDTYTLNTRAGVWYKPHQQGTVPQCRNYHSASLVHTNRPLAVLESDETDNAVLATPPTLDEPDVVDLDDMSDVESDMLVDSASFRSPSSQLDLASAFDSSNRVSRKLSQYLVVFGGWNGLNVLNDFDILAMESISGARRNSLASFLGSSDLSDVLITINNDSSRAIYAHKIVLASRSAYFRKLLSAGENMLSLTTNQALFEALLGYLYSDVVNMHDIGQNYREFIAIARMYAPEHVLRLTEEYLLSRVNCRSTLGADLQYGLQSKAFTDVNFIVGEGEERNRVSAHAVLLAAGSEYFRAMFLGGLKLDISKDVLLPDVPYRAFNHFIYYLYVSEVDFDAVESDGSIADLFSLANRFHSSDLIHLLEDVMLYNLSTENVVSLLLLGEREASLRLRSRCVDYFISHKDDIVQSEEYLEAEEVITSIVARCSTVQ
eukprot:TRINITY_DN2336_c0_g2_i4.p1 TRINITY_DN2336_c0_g2~~TRINITY_DN2336_c0_g2_i4.p1  ORF type:complete len:954 (-),score=97.34 TRINITY_DN2336_c0_g2_i4:65-2926(-)